MTEEEIVYYNLMNNSILYSEFRIAVELELYPIKEIAKYLKNEIKLYKTKPYILKKYYPSPDHFLDYIIAISKKLEENGLPAVFPSIQVAI